MTDHRPVRRETTERSPKERAADHAEIDRLADDLLPALVAKLGASGLGEIEVREGAWRVRVRRPAGAAESSRDRRTSDRPSRAQPGHAGHGHAAAGFESHRSARENRPVSHSTNGSSPALTAVGPGDGPASAVGPRGGDRSREVSRAVATSPAVGVFQPRSETRPGTRVRSGDRIGTVDMLGVPQEVVAPADGLVGASLVEPGQAVEYGQELVVIELAPTLGGAPATGEG
jgi:biotin carboxyl carrier protein